MISPQPGIVTAAGPVRIMHPLSVVHGPALDAEPGIGALTLGGWLREITAANADREALVFHDDGDGASAETRWTHGQLWQESMAVARALVALGVGRGARVGVLMTNRPEFLSAVFGTALAGGVAATFSTFSTPAELDHLIRTSACAVLLFERRVLTRDFAAMLVGLEPGIAATGGGPLALEHFPYLRHIAAIGSKAGDSGAILDWPELQARGHAVDEALVEARAAAVSPADPAVLFFSSGSTARPKGILSAHRGVALQLWRWRRFLAAGPDARAWSANGFFWSGNFGMAVGGALSAGGSLVLQSTFQPAQALDLMQRERATMAFAWPHQWAQLEAAPNWRDVDLSSLRYVNPDNALGRHPTVRTGWQEPLAAYGNTETFTISTIFDSGTAEDVIAGSSGAPLPGNSLSIRDPLSGEVLPIGQPGEIAVKGATLMLGYLGVPLAETLDADGWFLTGDGGFIDAAGRLFWKGRLNDIIKTGGANVSPAEVDAVIRQCPGVKVAQTVGVPDTLLGELVVSCIVPHADASLDEAAVRDFARLALASFKVPRRVLFFTEDALQLTGSAKIKVADLRALAVKRLEDEG